MRIYRMIVKWMKMTLTVYRLQIHCHICTKTSKNLVNTFPSDKCFSLSWFSVLNVESLKHKALALQASFFIAYVVTSGWTSVSTELFRIIPFFGSLITKPCKSPDDEFEVPPFPYYRDIPRLLFFGLLGITYFFLAPLILPFLLIYFCLAYIIYRNQVSLISFVVFCWCFFLFC